MMLKGQRDEQKEQLDAFIKTYGEFSMIFREFDPNKSDLRVTRKLTYDSADRARLQDPSKFPYQQQHRLYRSATDAAMKCLDEVSRIMQYVPDSYLTEIVTSRAFEDVKDFSMRKLQDDPAAAAHYVQMLLYGIQGLKVAMPMEFYHLLMQQLKPFITTIQSIQSFAKANNAKTPITQFSIPFDLIEHNFNQSLNP